jgi:2,3-bisphosphoglycerate-independent phosphoglycerate mutase
MIFLDGVGIGKKDGGVNPFFSARIPALRSLFEGEIPSLHHRRLSGHRASLTPLDANLGVPGLPQSGTGQTALFTGENGARIAGKHFGPYPYSTLRPVIERKNIFRRLLDSGKSPCFANAFPQRFFDYIEQHRSRMTVTTLSCFQCGMPLRRAEHLVRGDGISADITNAGWHKLGYPEMQVIQPAEAGRRLVRLLRRHDFVLFEYWKTDHAGHSGSMAEALEVLEQLDAMLVGVLDTLDTREMLLVLTSDHGNMEDMSVKTHTRNPVPALLYGHRHRELAERMERHSVAGADLCHVTPALLDLLTPHH